MLDDGVELRPADEVEAEAILASAQTAELGEPFELAAGLTIAVTAMEVRGDDAGPWLAVTARVENRTTDELSVPAMAILCDGSAEEGGWQADSTLALYDSLPSGSFLEGVVHLLLPYDGRYGEPRVECADPAVVRSPRVAVPVIEMPSWNTSGPGRSIQRMAVAPLNFHRRPLARLRCSRLRAANETAKKVLRSPSAAVFIATLLTGCGASGPLAEACAEVGDRGPAKTPTCSERT